MADLKTLYAALKADGAPLPDTYEQFAKYMTSGPQHGYEHRRAVYDALKADGAPLPDTYEKFSNALFDSKREAEAKAVASEKSAMNRGAVTKTVSVAPVAPTVQTPAASAPAPTVASTSTEPTTATRQPAWQPTEQEKIRRSYNLNTMLNDFKKRSKKRIEQAKRTTMHMTPEGRKKLKTAKFQAQLAGAPTQVLGLTPNAGSAGATAGEDQGDADGNMKPLESAQSPVPHGVKYVDGKPVTEWLLPDGTLTTDLVDADKAEYGARKVRLRNQFVDRMRQNGLDPAKPEDLVEQNINDALSINERRIKAIYDRRSQEIDESGNPQQQEESGFENFVRVLGASANRANSAMHPVPQGSQTGSRTSRTEDELILDNLLAENQMLEEARKRLRASSGLKKSEGWLNGVFDFSNNARNFYAGIKDKLTDPDLFGGGIIKLQQADRLISIEEKLKNGEQLSDSETSLVYASMLNGEVNSIADTPHGYNAGQTTTEMVPFMAQMMLNPASGLSKTLVKKFGTSRVKKLLATIGGDIAEAAVLSNTLQMPSTVADIKSRYIGDASIDADNNIEFNGNHNWAESIAKGQGASTIENYTELLGAHLGGILSAGGNVVTSAAKKVGLGKVVDNVGQFISNVKASDWAKAISNIESRAQWNGTVGEVLEEEAGIVLNSLLVGDNKLSDLTDADQQIDIVLGVGLFGGFVSGIKTGGYIAGRRKANLNLRKAERKCSSEYGEEWSAIQSTIDNAEDADIATTVVKSIAENAKTPEQANAVVSYASSLMKARGYNLANAKRNAEATQTNPEEAERVALENEAEATYDHGQELYERFEEGDMTVQADVDAIALHMQEAYDVLNDAFGPGEAEYHIASMEAPELTEEQRASAPWMLLDDPELTVEQKDAVLYYINAKAALDGVMDASSEAADRKRDEVDDSVKKRTHKDKGVIIPAETKMGKQVYIVKGNVVMFPDGSDVDVNNSSSQIYVLNPESGKYESSAPEFIERIGEAVNPQDEVQAAHAIIEQEQDALFNNGIAAAEATEPEQKGDTVLTKQESDPVLTEQGSEPVLAEQNFETPSDGQNIDAPLAEEKLEVIPTDPTAPTEQGAGVVPAGEDGQQNAPQTALARIPVDEAGEPNFEAADSETAWDGLVEAVGSEDDANEIALAQVRQATANLEALNKKPPTMKTPKLKGSPMAMAKAKREAMEQYQNDLAQYNQQIAEAQARIDAWNGIVGVHNSRKAESERQLRAEQEAWEAQKQRIDKKLRKTADVVKDCPEALEILENTSPQNIWEAASWVLSVNKLIPRNEGVLKGFREMTGYKTGEQRKLVGLFAKAENGGKTLERLAEDEMKSVCDENGIPYDNGEALNALLEVLQSCGTVGEIRNYIENNRIDQAMSYYERWRRNSEWSPEDEAEYEEYMFRNEHGGISRAEYEEWSGVFEESLEDMDRDFDENEFYGNIADESAIRRQKELINGNGQGEIAAGDQGSSSGRAEVLQESESAGAGSLSGTGGEVLHKAPDVHSQREGADRAESGIREKDGDEGTVRSSVLPADTSGGRSLEPSKGESFESSTEVGGQETKKIEPTEAQKAAGNYKMEHRRVDGYNISIENAKGSVRRGKDADGTPWETEMHNDYGYIRGTEGVDGDHIDVFLSDVPEEGEVFVVDQYNTDGSFDEHKVMYGFPTKEAAREAYLSNYEKGWENTRRIDITGVTKDEFRKWVNSSRRKTKPFVEYKSVKPIEDNGMIERSLTEQETAELIEQMEATAEIAPTIELTPENWIVQFGEDGTVETPIGTVKMGENQYFKMARQGREGKLGMVKPTLQNPDVVVEDYRPATVGLSERDTSYIFVKTFSKEDGSRYYYFTSVTVRKEGREVVISNQERSDKRISKLLQQGKVAWIDNGILHPKAQVGKSVPLNDSSNPTNSDNGTAMLGVNSSANDEMSPSSELRLTEAPSESKGQDLVPTSDNVISSDDKDNALSEDKQAIEGESFESEYGQTISDAFEKYLDFKNDSSFEGKASAIDACAKMLKPLRDKVAQMDERELSAVEHDIDAFFDRELREEDGSGREWLANEYTEWISSYTGIAKRRKDFDEQHVLESAIESAQELTSAVSRKTKVRIVKFVDPRANSVLGGVYHDPGKGMAIVSDSHVLVMSTKDYNPENAGKVIGADGNVRENVKYPDVARVIPSENHYESKDVVDFGMLEGMAENAMRLGKSETYPDQSPQIVVSSGNGAYAIVDALVLRNFARGARLVGAKEVGIYRNEQTSWLVANGQDGISLMIGKSYNPEKTLYKVNLGNRSEGSHVGAMDIAEEVSAGYGAAKESRDAWLSGKSDSRQLNLFDFDFSEDPTNGGVSNIAKAPKRVKSNLFDFDFSEESNPKPSKQTNERKSLERNEPKRQMTIEDFGEKIAGARKDMLHDLLRDLGNVNVESLVKLPFSKAIKRPDFGKMVERGAMTEDEAMTAEAMWQEVYSRRKPAATPRNKRAIVEWAKNTELKIRRLEDFINSDSERRREIMEQSSAVSFPNEETESWNFRSIQEMNRTKQFDTPLYTPSAAWVNKRVMEAAGMRPGSGMKIEYSIQPNMTYQYYELIDASGYRVMGFPSTRDLNSAVDMVTLATRMHSGDLDVEYPSRFFSAKGRNAIQVPTGEYEVGWLKGYNYKSEICPDEETANKKAASLNARGVLARVYPVKRSNGYENYAVRFRNPISGEEIILEESYPDRETALQMIEDDPQGLSQKVNAILAERQKGQKSAKNHFYVTVVYENHKLSHAVCRNNVGGKMSPWMNAVVKKFETRGAAEAWFKENQDRLESEYAEMMKQKRSFVYFEQTDRPRRGEDYRNGKDVTPEQFSDTFGFRGVQFGNWTNDADRQAALNEAYDALRDLAGVLGLDNRTLSLDGELGLAFGSRGSGSANAHYESTEVVINLTKTRGAGSLAHEWWHALDNYLMRKAGVANGFATEHLKGNSKIRSEIAAAITDLVKAVGNSDYAKRSAANGDYWGRMLEETARLFGEWVVMKQEASGSRNYFLSRGIEPSVVDMYRGMTYMSYLAECRDSEETPVSREEWNSRKESLGTFPYPTPEEVEEFSAPMERVFEALRNGSEDGLTVAEIAMEPAVRYSQGSLFDKPKMQARQLSLFDDGFENMELPDEATMKVDAAVDEYSEALAEIFKYPEEAVPEEVLDLMWDKRDSLMNTLNDYFRSLGNTEKDAAERAREMLVTLQAQVSVASLRREGEVTIDAGEPAESETKETDGDVAEENEVVTRETLGGDLVSYRHNGMLRELGEGEFSLMERRFSETGEFHFSGDSKIESADDVAYMLRNLEMKSVEHAFAVLTKDGVPTVVHLGMGSFTASPVNLAAVKAADNVLGGADRIWFVHNHPSGNLQNSPQDMNMHRGLRDMFGDRLEPSIILDTMRGQYAEFGETVQTNRLRPTESRNGEGEVRVYQFDSAVYSKDYDFSQLSRIRGSGDVAAFLSGYRLGEGEKAGVLILNQMNQIVGNLPCTYSIDTPEGVDTIVNYAIHGGGTSVIVYGNDVIPGQKLVKLGRDIDARSGKSIRLMDVITRNGNDYTSANDEGLMEPEAGYGDTSDLRPQHSEETNARFRDGENEELTGDGNKYRLVEKGEVLDWLESLGEDELVHVYRNVQILPDGTLASPMAAYNVETGEIRRLSPGRWNGPEERQIILTPEQEEKLATLKRDGEIQGKNFFKISNEMRFYMTKKDGVKLQFNLTRDGSKDMWADYNPYDHAIKVMLNDQFKAAWKRPNLVVVEAVMPKSEIEGAYHAPYASLPTGEHKWNNGRSLYLSRWSKIVRIVPFAEVAADIDRYWRENPSSYKGAKVTDYDRFQPQVREELEQLGYRFDDKEKRGAMSEAERDKAYKSENAIYVTNEDIAHMNAEMTQEWYKTPSTERALSPQPKNKKEAEQLTMLDRVKDLSEKLNTPIRIITKETELQAVSEDGKPRYSRRERRAKGWWSAKDDEVVIVLPNNVNVADVENTFVHEVVGHKGLRAMIGKERFDEFLGEVYDHSSDPIRRVIDKMTDDMVNAEVERLRARKAEARERAGEDVNANYYADMAGARLEAEARRGDFRREATEEYMADLGGRIGNDGFEKMSLEELTLWGKIKAKVQQFLDRFLQGLQIAKSIQLTDKDLAYILYKSWKNIRERGASGSRSQHGGIFAEAEDAVMRRRTGWDEAMLSESAKIEDANKAFNKQLSRYINDEMTIQDYIEVGKPLGIMKMFLSDVPIVVRQRVLHKASVTKHNIDLSQLQDLPGMLAEPIFVFKRDAKTLGVLTELRDRDGKNVCVAIELNRSIQSGVEFLEVNDIRSLHGRDASNIVLPIAHNNTLQYVDKKKGLAWLSSASSNYQQEIAKQDLDSAAKIIKSFENPIFEGDEDVRFRDGADYVERNRVMASAMYEKQIQTNMYQFTEAMQDSMRGLMEFYQAVESQGAKHSIENVASFENAYTAENGLSSRNHAETEEYEHRIMRPLLDIAARMAVNKKGCQDLTDYMMAKHGLERNIHMRNEALAKNEDTERDFAGLCGLTGKNDWRDAENAAQQMVDDYEKLHSSDIDELWKAVNLATKTSLKKVYDCGLLSKEQYERIRDMYDYYVPLRGFDEQTSNDVYGYLTGKESTFSSPIKKAEGRKSKADDPLATIAYMAQNSIIQGNRNLMKQKFLTYVQNHPSDLASVNRLWLVHDETTDVWKPVFADVNENMAPDEIDKAVMDFERRMETLSKSEPDKYKRGRDAINIPYRLIDGNVREHQVIVKRNGESFVITINGNPRAAQAVNGLTNPDNDLNGAIGKVFNLANYINRQLSQVYTTRNPDFVVSNFIRDLLYSNAMVHVKEDQAYAMRFHKNHTKVNPIRMIQLLHLYEADKLDMRNPLHRMFYEFMHWGGETGYTLQRDLDHEKKFVNQLMAESRRGKLNPKSVLSLVGNNLDQINRGVENSARFAAFITSRESGRDVQRSVYDAKEISVNFNKKGAGSKFMDAKGQTFIGKAAGFTSGLGRSFYVFWNAAVQGTTNYGKAFKKHPWKAIPATTSLVVLGYLIAALMDDGDDEDKNGYYNVPKYTRRSNLMFRAGDQWITVPLPVEYRAVYGLGELAYSVTSGREEYTNMELTKEISAQLSQILPLDVMEGSGGLHAFVPSAFKPLVETAGNTSWTGLPIYKDTPFNKDMPEWTKAYPRANTQLVDLSKWANEASGGNDYKAGWANFNPAQLEYLLNGYFGGYSNIVNKMVKTGETMLGEREYDPSSILLVNRLVKTGDERTAEKKINSDFFKYLEEYKRTHALLRKYEEEADRGSNKYGIFLDALRHSRDGARHDVMDEYITDYNWLNRAIKDPETSDDERENYEDDMRKLKREVVTLMKVAHDQKQVDNIKEQFAKGDTPQ